MSIRSNGGNSTRTIPGERKPKYKDGTEGRVRALTDQLTDAKRSKQTLRTPTRPKAPRKTPIKSPKKRARRNPPGPVQVAGNQP